MWYKGCWLRHNAECDVMQGMLIKTQYIMVNVMWCKGCWLRHNAECDVM